MNVHIKDRDVLLELIGKRMRKLHIRTLPFLERCLYGVDKNYWQAMYYYNPNVIYTWKTFAGDRKLKLLGDEYIANYGGVKAKLLFRFREAKT